MKYIGPKAKKCRRQGTNLYGADKYDRILQRKPYGPGKGPRTRQGRRSEYAEQLHEKQKVRDTFGISERQFRRVFRNAQRRTGKTGQAMLEQLEQRLDNVLYRAGFALTRLQARQLAGHGLFLINGRRCTVPSRALTPGDVITVRPRSAGSALFTGVLTLTEKHVPPPWLKADPRTLSIEVLSVPAEEHLEQGLDIQKVVELCSR